MADFNSLSGRLPLLIEAVAKFGPCLVPIEEEDVD